MTVNQTFDFSSRTYSTIRQDLLARAGSVAPEWTDRDPSDFGMVFVDLWSYIGDVLHYYVDRAARESFITTATQRESLIAYANLYDYIPNGRESATATVYISNSSTASSGAVTLPAYSRFAATYDDTRYYFYTQEEVTLNPGITTAVTAVEGTRVDSEVLTSSSSGSPGQSYTLANSTAAISSIKVYVTEEGNEIEWSRYQSIVDIPGGVKGFSVYLTSDGNVQVIFGNRINGFIPPAGSRITTSYTKSSGSNGNIPANLINSFVSLPANNISISSSTPSTGGTNGETAETLKSNIIGTLKTQNRAVTLQDYQNLTTNVPGVHKAVAVYTPASGGSSAGASVSLYALPYVSDFLTPSSSVISVSSNLRDSIYNYVSPKSMIGISVAVPSSIDVYKLNVTTTVYVDPQYVSSWVKADVQSAIDGLLSFDNTDFGKEIPLSKIYKAIMNVDGVDYATISVCGITTYSGTSYKNYLTNTGSDLPAVAILQKGSVTINTVNGMTTAV